MTTPNKPAITGGIDARLAAYVTLAGVALGGAAAAKADFVYSGVVNINIPSTTAGIYINLVTGATGTDPNSVPGWDLNPWGTNALNIWANNSASPDSGVITDWPEGTSATLVDNIAPFFLGGFPFHPIDNSRTYGRTSSIETTGPTAFVLNSNQNRVGFRFLNETTGQYDYGWADFSLGSTFGGQPRTLVSYVYENNGNPIVPEPPPSALLSLFAVGAFGVRVWRKAQASLKVRSGLSVIVAKRPVSDIRLNRWRLVASSFAINASLRCRVCHSQTLVAHSLNPGAKGRGWIGEMEVAIGPFLLSKTNYVAAATGAGGEPCAQIAQGPLPGE
jgi:hypothetical protein